MNWIIFAFIFLLSSCQPNPQERHYTESTIESSPKTMPDPHQGLDMSDTSLSWKIPTGWQETAGSGMRLVSFHLKDDPQSIDCSIVSLGGMAGGLEANLRRWMGQIGLQPSQDEFDQLINSSQSLQTQDAQEAKIYDFSALQKDRGAKSIIVAMIATDTATVFIKMTGSKEAIEQNKAPFLELVRSIKEK